MPKTDAQKRATLKYDSKAYDRLNIIVPKGKKTDLQVHAESRGESLNGFVNRAIDEAIDRDKLGCQPGDLMEYVPNERSHDNE